MGTPLPAEEDEKNVYHTAGTLDDPLGVGIKNHTFYCSRADSDRDGWCHLCICLPRAYL